MAVSDATANILRVTGAEASLDNFAGKQGAARTALSAANPKRVLVVLTRRLVIGSGDGTAASLALTPAQSRIFFGSGTPNGPLLDVTNGGTLTLGTVDATGGATTYSLGDAVVAARAGVNASDELSGSLRGQAGSTVTLRGCSIRATGACWFKAHSGGAADCILRMQDVEWQTERVNNNDYFAPRLFTADYQIRDCKFVGGVIQIQSRGPNSVLEGLRLERMAGGIGVTGGNFGAATDFFTVKGLDGGHGSTLDVNVFNGYKARILNSRQGSDTLADLQSRNHATRSFGCLEVRQEVRFEFADSAGADLDGVRVYLDDTDHGRQAAVNWTAKNAGPNGGGSPSTGVDYQAGRSYNGTSAAGVVEMDVLLASKVYNARPVGGATLPAQPWVYRGKANDSSDRFDFHFWSYEHLYATSEQVLKSASKIAVPWTLFDDPTVTKTRAQAAALAGLAVDHAAHTITVTAAVTLDDLRDWLKYRKTLDADRAEPSLSTEVAVPNGSELQVREYNVAVNAGGRLTAGARFRSLLTAGAVSTAGNGSVDVPYTDSSGKSLTFRSNIQNTRAYVEVVPPLDDQGNQPASVFHDLDTGVTMQDTLSVPVGSQVKWVSKAPLYDYVRGDVVVGSGTTELAMTHSRNENVQNINIVTRDGTGLPGADTVPPAVSAFFNVAYFHRNPGAGKHEVRLGAISLKGQLALGSGLEVSKALFDRLMTTPEALRATYDHADVPDTAEAFGGAYRIDDRYITIDERWLDFVRHAGLGNLRKSEWGAYVRTRTFGTYQAPVSATGQYVVISDELEPTITRLSTLNAAADRFLTGVRTETDAIATDVAGVEETARSTNRLVKYLSDLGLWRNETSVAVLGLGGWVWGGSSLATFESSAAHLQVTYTGDNIVGEGGEYINQPAGFSQRFRPPAGSRLLLRMTIAARNMDGDSTRREFDPNLHVTLGSQADPHMAVAMNRVAPTHSVRLVPGDRRLGLAQTVEFDLGRYAADFTATQMALEVDPASRPGDEVRLTISKLEFIYDSPTSLADFQVDAGSVWDALTADATTAGSFGQLLKTMLDAAVSTRLAAAGYTAPPAAVDLSTLEGRLTAERAENLDNLDIPVSDVEKDVRFKPTHMASFANNAVAVTQAEANKAIATAARTQARIVLPTGTLARSVVIYRVDGVLPNDDVVLTIAQYGEGTALDHGSGHFRVYVANDIDAFANEAAFLQFEGANNPVLDTEYGVVGEPDAIAQAAFATTPMQTTFNRIVVEYYRNDAGRALDGDTTLTFQGLAVLGSLPLFIEEATRETWDALTAGITRAGSFGVLLKAMLDAAVSTRLAAADYAAPMGAADLSTLEGRLTAARAALLDNLAPIKDRTDNLPADTAEKLALLEQLLNADMEVNANQVILRYNGTELVRFNRRNVPTDADWSGGRSRVV